ncbi:MAG: restriction endonuclease subunit S, partial [Elusimicrobiota bacterium]
SCGTTLAPAGSIIVSTREPIGYVAILGKDICCNQGCRILIKERIEINERYYYYFLSILTDVLDSLGQGSTFKELSHDKLSNLIALNVPIEEQKQIVDFLDHKTAQIDSQVVQEKKSIELLKEYRTALISEVVTGKVDVRESVIPAKAGI